MAEIRITSLLAGDIVKSNYPGVLKGPMIVASNFTMVTDPLVARLSFMDGTTIYYDPATIGAVKLFDKVGTIY